MTMYELAMGYAQQGYSIFPCNPESKRPMVKGGFKSATKNADQFKAWWDQWPDAMPGLPTGDGSGYFVLDVDERETYSGNRTLADLEQSHGKLPETWEASTPSGGRHLYFRHVDGLSNSAGKVGVGLDIRATGGYVIAPGSVATGGEYKWTTTRASLAGAPEWLLALAMPPTPKQGSTYAPTPKQGDPYAAKAFEKALVAVAGAGEGCRNDTLNREAHGLFGLAKAGRLDEPLVRRAMGDMAAISGLDEGEITATLNSAWGKAQPRYEGLTERLNDTPIVGALMQNPTEDNVALAYRERHVGEFIYIHGRGKWFQWDGKRWSEDQLHASSEAVRKLARAYNVKGGAAAAKHGFVRGCLGFAQSDPAFARLASAFDNDNYLLNCPDGTWNLVTGKRRDHNPDDNITLITATSPSNEHGGVFQKFLSEIFENNQDLIDWLQVALGACLSGAIEDHWILFWLSGAIEDHWILFWIGAGRNGKNTLGDLIAHILGEYAKAIPSDTLMSKKNAEHKTEIANLQGCRLAVASETEEGDFWAESKLKSLTGDAMLSGRYMRQDFIHFQRTHKHLIYGNHRPQLRSLDKAMRSRLKVVPFNVSFDGREDAMLPKKLLSESGYVLHWLMEGHKQWIKQGRKVGTCEAITHETADYFAMQATIESWIDENCTIVPIDGRPACEWAKVKDLYSNFKTWCAEANIGTPSLTRFGEKMKRLGFEKVKSDGYRYKGVELKLNAKNWGFGTPGTPA